MSELKHQLVMTKEHSWVFAYPKSEADKVIAELKHDVAAWMDSYEVSRKTNARTESELRYQKYKRCLAMARWCRTSARYDEGIGAFKYRDWYWKWFKRWLELAEKFKEAK